MDPATQDLMYQKIKELVYDEEKIITCTTIAANLNISLNEAKSLLMAFVKDYREINPEEFSVTYLLCGGLKSGQGLVVHLVKEEELNQKKCLFDTISSEFVYSIQKGKTIDLTAIALVDKMSIDQSTKLYEGSVISRNCMKRKLKVKQSPVKQEVSVKEDKSFFKKFQSDNEVKTKVDIQENSKDPSKSQQKQTKPKQVRGITNFFAKAAVQANGVKPEIKLSDENISKDVHQKIDQGVKIDKSTVKEEKMDVDNENIEPTVKKTTNQNNSKKRKNRNKADNSSNKRRKRIQEVCDSDSSDMFDEEENEDIIEKSDEEPEPPLIIKPTQVPKNKKRKAVDRTYKDEDGFIVTSTEYVYETASEDEENEVLKTQPKEQIKVLLEKKNSVVESASEKKSSLSVKEKKTKKPVIGKQSTLMSFFKKN